MRKDNALRTYIDHEKLKKLFEQKLSLYAIHERTGYPITTLQKIKKGEKVDWFISRKSLRMAAKAKGVKLCTCCELNPVMDGLKFLCKNCFKYASNEGMDTHSVFYKTTIG